MAKEKLIWLRLSSLLHATESVREKHAWIWVSSVQIDCNCASTVWKVLAAMELQTVERADFGRVSGKDGGTAIWEILQPWTQQFEALCLVAVLCVFSHSISWCFFLANLWLEDAPNTCFRFTRNSPESPWEYWNDRHPLKYWEKAAFPQWSSWAGIATKISLKTGYGYKNNV